MGRISSLTSTYACSASGLAGGLAGVGNDLKFAGFDEGNNSRVFVRPCADPAFFARPEEKPLSARKRNAQWFLRRVLDCRQSRVSPLNRVQPQLGRGMRTIASRWPD
jgi:hypothetical protein